MLLRTIVNEALTNEHDLLYYYRAIESMKERIGTILYSPLLSNDERGLITTIAAAYHASIIPYINDANPEVVAKAIINLTSTMYSIGSLGATALIGLVDSSSISDIVV